MVLDIESDIKILQIGLLVIQGKILIQKLEKWLNEISDKDRRKELGKRMKLIEIWINRH